MVVVRIAVCPVITMVYGFVHNVSLFTNDGRLINDMLNVIFFSFPVLLGVTTCHLVLILALLVLEVAFIFTRSDMSFIQVEVLKLIVTMVLLVMLVGGLTIKFPLLVSAFVLQVLLVITVDITIVSMLCNYRRWMLMDDMVDRLVEVMDSFFRHLVNRSQVALIIIPVSIRVRRISTKGDIVPLLLLSGRLLVIDPEATLSRVFELSNMRSVEVLGLVKVAHRTEITMLITPIHHWGKFLVHWVLVLHILVRLHLQD